MRLKFLRQTGFGFAAAVLSMFGCNGIGCEGCDGGRGERGFPTHATTPNDGGGGAKSDGGVSVTGAFNSCPTVSLQAAPVMVRVGQSLMVMASASDIDPDDKNLLYTWTATSGYFGENGEPRATFTCTEAGPVTLTVAVSDGSCTVNAPVGVFCVAIRDGGVGGSSASTGAGGGGGGGGGAGGSGPVNTCPAAEPTRGGPNCAKCTTDNCVLGPDGTDGCCGLASTADQLLCQALYACISANAATCTSAGDPTKCFCGTNQATCFMVPGVANGPCVNETLAAAKTIDPATIRMRFISGMYPVGRAVNLATCQGGLCAIECAFPTQ